MPISLEPMFDGRTFAAPVAMRAIPSQPGAWLVVGHRGRVERVRDGRIDTFLDITDRVEHGSEMGLHDVAPAPDFPSDPRVFAVYTAAGRVSRLSVFRSTDGGETLDPGTEAVMLSEAQPVAFHAIASVLFGPDGFLYVAWGEGGIREGEPRPALRGKILRLDVAPSEGERPFAIPTDNPFVGTDVPAEAYAIGLRMPWRFSFDRATGELWAGDVGTHHFEEIDRVVKGADYGWPAWEGTLCLAPEACVRAANTPPFYQQTHSELCAIVGGYVYRGRAMGWLSGMYVYADSCTGTIWALDVAAERPIARVVARSEIGVASFAEDDDGELYVVELRENEKQRIALGARYRIRKLMPNPDAAGDATAQAGPIPSLAATGCVARGDARAAPPDFRRYELNQRAWEDGAETIRFAGVRPMDTVWGVDVEMFAPTPDSTFIKTYLVDGRPIETQMLARRRDGIWDAYDYAWNDAGTDAVAVSRATDLRIGPDRVWRLPGPEGCARCHNQSVGMVRGFSVSQLNRPSDDGVDQIAMLESLGVIVWPWKGGEIPVMPPVADESFSLAQRARAYLHVNCAHCHQPGGRSDSSRMDLRRETPLVLTGTCGEHPSAEHPGHADALLIAPGDPARSLVSIRVHDDGAGAMPPGRARVDSEAAELIDAWIRSLDACSEPHTAAGDQPRAGT